MNMHINVEGYKKISAKAMPKIQGKWPSIYVTGKRMKKSDAIEFIRRTDYFFYGCYGNEREWIYYCRNALGVPSYRNKDEYPDFKSYVVALEKYNKKNKWIKLNYLYSDQISCCYYMGPYGLVYPDGTVLMCKNIGKYPKTEDVISDARKIARAFNMIDCRITLADEEWCDTCNDGLFTIWIQNGKVTITEPVTRDIEYVKDVAKHYHIPEGENCETSIKRRVIDQWSKIMKK